MSTASPAVLASLDEFTRCYIECALWASDDGEGVPLSDCGYDASDIAPAALAGIVEECRQFQSDNAADLALRRATRAPLEDGGEGYGSDAQSGHDFWLTRNRHGAGFWDRGLGALGTRLTDAAHAWGSSDLYVGDDGLIYVM